MDDWEKSGPVYVVPIKPANIIPILRADADHEWLWILLPNGDRIVGFFPYEEGAEYFHDEDHRQLNRDDKYRLVNEVDLFGCDVCDRNVPADMIVHSLGVDNGQGDTSQCQGCIDKAQRDYLRGRA